MCLLWLFVPAVVFLGCRPTQFEPSTVKRKLRRNQFFSKPDRIKLKRLTTQLHLSRQRKTTAVLIGKIKIHTIGGLAEI